MSKENAISEAVDLEAAITAGVSVANTPHPADIIDGPQPNVRHAIAVTEEHGLQVHKLEVPLSEITNNPFRVTGERTVSDLDSFLAEIERRPLRDDSTIWGNADRGRLTAIYNDHTSHEAGWRDDKLTLALAVDEDWKAWHALSGQSMKQQPFGDRIEELLHTIVDPDQAELLEIIDSIRVSSGGNFESRIERADGSQKLLYQQENKVSAGKTGELEIPTLITLSLRPWDNHPTMHEVQAYFRVWVHDGNLTLTVKLKPTRQIVREAWYDITQAISGQAGKPVLAVQ
jgi:uncharacterized protein YfdQ (DUF2303 family)